MPGEGGIGTSLPFLENTFYLIFCTNLVFFSSAGVNCVAFKPDNPNILVSCSDDKTIKMWDITSGSCLSTLTGHSGAVAGVAFSADGQWLMSGSRDKTIRLWDARPGGIVVSAV